jgi:hypothetical protein
VHPAPLDLPCFFFTPVQLAIKTGSRREDTTDPDERECIPRVLAGCLPVPVFCIPQKADALFGAKP